MEETVKPKSQSLTYGIVYGLLSAMLLYLYQKLNIEAQGIHYLMQFVAAIICIYISIDLYKKTNINQLSISNALFIGLLVGLIGGIIYSTYAYFHYDVLFSDYFAEKIAIAKEQIKEQNPQLTEAQLAQSEKIADIFSSPIIVSISAIIGTLIETFLVALVIGLIKKNN